MHAKCSLRKMHLEVGRKNVTRPGPTMNYLSRAFNEIHQSFHMTYGKVHVMKGWVQFLYQELGNLSLEQIHADYCM